MKSKWVWKYTTSSLSFRSGIIKENERASEREIACRVEKWHACRVLTCVTFHAASDFRARSLVRFPRLGELLLPRGGDVSPPPSTLLGFPNGWPVTINIHLGRESQKCSSSLCKEATQHGVESKS